MLNHMQCIVYLDWPSHVCVGQQPPRRHVGHPLDLQDGGLGEGQVLPVARLGEAARAQHVVDLCADAVLHLGLPHHVQEGEGEDRGGGLSAGDELHKRKYRVTMVERNYVLLTVILKLHNITG